jgi:hypothetical protein
MGRHWNVDAGNCAMIVLHWNPNAGKRALQRHQDHKNDLFSPDFTGLAENED